MKKIQTTGNWLYMHTIDGCPAEYIPNNQIVYANGTRGNAGVWHLASTPQQIRYEQRLSNAWRKAQNYAPNNNLGYVRIAKSALIS